MRKFPSAKERQAITFHVGQRLRNKRRRRRLKADKLDNMIGERPGTIAKLERGVRDIAPGQLIRLGRALGVEAAYFFQRIPDDFFSGGKIPVPRKEMVKEAEKFIEVYYAVGDSSLRNELYHIVKSLSDPGADPEKARPFAARSVNYREQSKRLPAKPVDFRGLQAIESTIAATGMICRGAFHPRAGDGVPDGAGTVVLLGNAGPALWASFCRQRRDKPHPLDSWTRRVLGKAARNLAADFPGVRALFPFEGPPYLPFQRWARRVEPVHFSPLGQLIHPEFGLWHAYRGALLFGEKLDLPRPQRRPSPCRSCAGKPCLTACPADVFKDGAFDMPACIGYLEEGAGKDRKNCLDRGCLARGACPVGLKYAYRPAQAAFHMQAFLAAHD